MSTEWKPSPRRVNNTDQFKGDARVLLAPTKNATRRFLLIRGQVEFYETMEQAKEAADAHD